MAGPTKTYNLQHADGTAVTAQEVYNAFTSGIVLLDDGNGQLGLVKFMYWQDSSGGQSDPTNVVGCEIRNPFTDNSYITIGTLV